MSEVPLVNFYAQLIEPVVMKSYILYAMNAAVVIYVSSRPIFASGFFLLKSLKIMYETIMNTSVYGAICIWYGSVICVLNQKLMVVVAAGVNVMYPSIVSRRDDVKSLGVAGFDCLTGFLVVFVSGLLSLVACVSGWFGLVGSGTSNSAKLLMFIFIGKRLDYCVD